MADFPANKSDCGGNASGMLAECGWETLFVAQAPH